MKPRRTRAVPMLNLGLHISWTKTNVQNIGAVPPAQTIMVDGQLVEGVDNFTYLGSQLSFVDGSRTSNDVESG